jgi:hypothetical protein
VSAHWRLARSVASIAVTGGALWLLAAASAFPVLSHRSKAGELRLSWSARPERIERCRMLSAEELARREEHMRQRMECEGRSATYALQVAVDEHQISEAVVQGAGLRHDRPLYLLRDFAVSPGPHRVRITLTRRERTDNDTVAFAPAPSQEADTGLFAGRAQREAVERARRAREAIPPRLTLDTSLVFSPRRVVLITLDAERKTLVVHAGSAPPR